MKPVIRLPDKSLPHWTPIEGQQVMEVYFELAPYNPAFCEGLTEGNKESTLNLSMLYRLPIISGDEVRRTIGPLGMSKAHFVSMIQPTAEDFLRWLGKQIFKAIAAELEPKEHKPSAITFPLGYVCLMDNGNVAVQASYEYLKP